MELLGDGWTLVVLRDLVFGDARHFTALHRQSLEGIATNVLADRLERLLAAGLVTRSPDPHHSQRVNYRLTEQAIQLVPVLATLGEWGAQWLPVTDDLAARARVLAAGGPELWDEFMEELRAEHLRGERPAAAPVRDRLDQAFEEASAAAGP